MQHRHRIKWITLGLVGVVAAVAPLASAWHEKEHFAITHAAAKAVDDDLPAFFRERGPIAAAHCAVDPDLFKNEATPHLNHAEFPEHFLDLEYLGGDALPERRHAYLKLLHERELDPARVGLLPYAIAEWTDRLTIAFAEHRRRPDDEGIRAKCLVYAGHLAHYAGDLWQPLHTTIHYDGRVDKAGAESPRTGIHARVDGLLRRIEMPADWAKGVKPEAYDSTWKAIVAELHASHRLVDRVYALEDRLPRMKDKRIEDEGVEALGVELARNATRFTASLYMTAWARSAEVELPHWFDREKADELTR